MVKITGYRILTNGTSGESFNALLVQGVVLVKSKETSAYYATSKQASIPCTFSEDVCKSMIDHEIDGSLKRFDCAPYTVTNQETGEIIKLNYRYEYVPEQSRTIHHSEEVMELSELEELAD